jgi:hypothetical protein
MQESLNRFKKWCTKLTPAKAFFGFFLGGLSVTFCLLFSLKFPLKFFNASSSIWHIYEILAIASLSSYFLLSLSVLWFSSNTYPTRVRLSFRSLVIIILLIISAISAYEILNAHGLTKKNKTLKANDRIHLNGSIDLSTYTTFKDILKNSTSINRVVVNSGGGEALPALGIAKLIQQYNLDIQVDGICASSCANFLFIAANKKILNESSIIMYHGGPFQKNILQLAVKADAISVLNSIGDISILGNVGKEGSITVGPIIPESDDWKELLQFVGAMKTNSIQGRVIELQQLTQELYAAAHVDIEIMTLGQEGKYKELYHSYQYSGFFYSPEDMKKLGIQNIVLHDKAWSPEKNPEFKNFYQVKLTKQ